MGGRNRGKFMCFCLLGVEARKEKDDVGKEEVDVTSLGVSGKFLF
jgi:hypothetical protein